MNKKVYTKEKVIGWFTTLTDINITHAIVHKYYTEKTSKFTPIKGILPSPLLLTIDPKITNGSFDLRVHS